MAVHCISYLKNLDDFVIGWKCVLPEVFRIAMAIISNYMLHYTFKFP